MDQQEIQAYVHLMLGSIGFGTLLFFFYLDAYNPNVSVPWYMFVMIAIFTAALLRLDMSKFPWSLFDGI